MTYGFASAITHAARDCVLVYFEQGIAKHVRLNRVPNVAWTLLDR